ncbi:non-ribosomal peptide synthetase [Chitinophaga solisilvae]|uniref:non-ribosomal peptide synthetase n=1 Tax=Chitinophaga solisilvae TaxID=1233460 RepID=UPI001370E833|nr:non-ribosomal peptide synthetase [Chitinophaga solisilvae]
MKYISRETYWQQILRQDIPLLQIPATAPVDKEPVSVSVTVSPELRERITAVTKAQPMGKYIFYLTCFSALIAKYTGEEVIALVSPQLPGYSDMQQEGVNLIIAQMDAGATGRQLLNGMKERITEMLPFQGITPPSGTGTFAFIDTAMQEPVPALNSRFLLCVSGDSLELTCTGGHSRAFIAQLLRHFCRLAQLILEQPDQPVAELEVTDEAERLYLADSAGKYDSGVVADGHFLDHFMQQLQRVPHAPAVKFRNKTLSYAELERKSNQIAGALKARNVGYGNRVVVVMDRSDKLLAAMLAIWKLGAVYVPVDPASPRERVMNIVRDAAARHIVLEYKHRLLLEYDEQSDHILAESIDNNSDEYTQAEPVAGSLAYIIYTSGSTGNPKGVMVNHKGMLNHLLVKIKDLAINADSVVAQNASQGFDISIWQFLSALMTGGCTRVYSNEDVKDVTGFPEKVYADGVTVLQVVPAYLRALYEMRGEEDIQRFFGALSYLVVTGEEFRPSLANRCFRLLKNTHIVNAYGPTETSDDVTHYTMTSLYPEALLPIGVTLPNIFMYVTDGNGRLCPDGMKGEIWISGAGTGDGYWNDPLKTAAAFMPDPFVPARGMLFKSGDLGCRLPDGNFIFFGRKDDQVKINGCRIELREIEMHLLKMEMIQDAVVLPAKTPAQEQSLHAFLLCPAAEQPDETTVREFLKTLLPAYMVPSGFTFLESFPTLPSGKTDKKSLLEKQSAAPSVSTTAAMTPTEQQLMQIWETVLGTAIPGKHAHFFEQGGNSLHALQAVVAINKNWNVTLDIQEIFDYPVLGQLAARIPADSGLAGTTHPAGTKITVEI